MLVARRRGAFSGSVVLGVTACPFVSIQGVGETLNVRRLSLILMCAACVIAGAALAVAFIDKGRSESVPSKHPPGLLRENGLRFENPAVDTDRPISPACAPVQPHQSGLKEAVPTKPTHKANDQDEAAPQPYRGPNGIIG